MPESDRNSLVGLFSLRPRRKPVLTNTFKMVADQRKWGVPIYSKCCNFVNNSWNCTKFEAQGDRLCPSDLAYFDLGVTSRDLSMTLTVFFLNLGVSGR